MLVPLSNANRLEEDRRSWVSLRGGPPGGLETGFFRDWKIFTWGVEARRLERPPRRRQVAVEVIGEELFAVIFGLVAYDPAGVCDAPEGAGVV